METVQQTHIEAMSGCVDACQQCHRSCLDAVQHLLEARPGSTASPLFAALATCIGLTRIAAETVLAASIGHDEACQACAAACRACAELCRREPGLGECAASCLGCAQCCEAAMDEAA